MNKNLLIALLAFGSIEVTSQYYYNDTLLICDNNEHNDMWVGVSLNSDREKVHYLEFGSIKAIKPTREWKEARDVRFRVQDIRFSRLVKVTAGYRWDILIERDSLESKIRIHSNIFGSHIYDVDCSIVEDKDLFQSRVDAAIEKYELAQQEALQRKKEAEERARLAKEAQKKKNKI